MENILTKIYRAVSAFLQPLVADEAYKIIIKEAITLVGAEYGSLMLEQNGELKVVCSTLPVVDKIKTSKSGFARRSFDERKAFVVPAASFDKFHQELKKINVCSNIYIPLSFKIKSMGVLVINSCKEEKFTNRELNALKLFGSIVSLKIRDLQLYEEMKKALESRDLFISMAAHELRTPLTTISGYVQLLKNKFPKSNSQESRWLEELSWETVRLTVLVNELLVVNRIKSGQLHYVLRECSLREVINRAILDFQFNFPHHIIVLQDKLGSNQDTVVGDFDKLLQVMINLLNNAGKFSPEGTEIILNLRFRSPYIILNIRDQGVGISRKDLSRVFEGFYKGGDSSREGMGLGLFLAKNIIEEHRGSIHIHSWVKKGTLVEVQLPKAKYE